MVLAVLASACSIIDFSRKSRLGGRRLFHGICYGAGVSVSNYSPNCDQILTQTATFCGIIWLCRTDRVSPIVRIYRRPVDRWAGCRKPRVRIPRWRSTGRRFLRATAPNTPRSRSCLCPRLVRCYNLPRCASRITLYSATQSAPPALLGTGPTESATSGCIPGVTRRAAGSTDHGARRCPTEGTHS